MLILSVDMGEKNLGYTIAKSKFFNNETKISDIEFYSGVYDLNTRGKNNIVISRINSLSNFLNYINSIYVDEKLFAFVIEKQVPTNLAAMEMMYGLIGLIFQFTKNIFIFDPKLKFNLIGQIYSTINKSHKKQSIKNMETFLNYNLSESFSNLSNLLISTKKKDDIADSFNQLMVYLSNNNFINLSLDELSKLYNKL